MQHDLGRLPYDRGVAAAVVDLQLQLPVGQSGREVEFALVEHDGVALPGITIVLSPLLRCALRPPAVPSGRPAPSPYNPVTAPESGSRERPSCTRD
ncbi:hypothetical protein OHA71_18055 [Streptomyces sp. NBC_00444]|uniref:hypothetical protein n=1 Tax=Streptomyces sp. NBC_00444 TaxID=2975744 RepID=UPI002E1CD75B